MNHNLLIDQLNLEKNLSREDWETLIASYTEADASYAAALARDISQKHFGNAIYFRGIIEFSNICKNNCLYCGIRRENGNLTRYRLTEDEILECCAEGYALGYRTFVLQSGEDGFFTDERLCALVRHIREKHPDCAVTLSVGERSRDSYQALFDAGATRFLLRHETADQAHYHKLHPADMSFSNRMECLKILREIGYQVGCGMMVGSPYQTPAHLARDMRFMGEFRPAMVGMGPFIPHKDTPFGHFPAGSTALTLFLLSLTRIMLPTVLLPSTTALGSVSAEGRQQGVLCGCNVVMPNLSPASVRKQYMLYDNKAGTEQTAAAGLQILTEQMEAIGYRVVVGRGDYRPYTLQEGEFI